MRADPGKPKVVKVRAHTRVIKPRKVDPGAVAAGQRYAALGTHIAAQNYAAKTPAQRASSRAAARKAGGAKTRTQRAYLQTSGQWNSPSGQGRGAIAKRYSSPQAGKLLAQTHAAKPVKIKAPDAQSIIKTKLATDAKQAALTRKSLVNAKVPWFDKPARSGTMVALENLTRLGSGIGAEVKGRVTNPAGNLTGSRGHDTFKEGFLHPKEHAADWNDTFRAAGVHNKTLNSVLATTASIATDPTTYFAAGLGTGAREAGVAAFRSALKHSPEDVTGAIRAGREAAAATGEAGQRRGVKVGFRGLPVRAVTGKRQVLTKPLGGTTKQAIVDAGRRVGVKHVGAGQVGKDVRETFRRAVGNPNVKPRGWEDFEWEVTKMAGNTGRAGERNAEHYANVAAHGIAQKTKHWTDEQHVKVLTALEHNNPASLAADERAVYDSVDRLRHTWAQREGRSTEGRVGVGAAPATPSIPNPITHDDINFSRGRVKSAVAELRGQQKNLEDTLRGVGVVHGRTQGLSESVGGTEARKAAQRAKQPEFAAGAHGMSAAETQLAKARAGVEAARNQVRDATRAHAFLKQRAGSERMAVRDFTRRMQDFNAAPEGYVPRRLKPELTQGATRRGTGRKTVGTSTSYQARHLTKRLDQMTPDELAQFETNIPQLIRLRGLEHARNTATGERNRWAAGLGDKVDLSVQDAKDLGGRTDVRYFARDELGNIKPLWSSETSKFDTAKAINHINKGHEIIEVNPDKLDTINRLSTGGHSVAPDTPEDLLRPQPGEARENFAKRAHRTWKWWATAPNPSYHMRNVVGDTFNALIAGTTSNDFRHALAMNNANTALKAIEKSIDSPEGRRALEVLRAASSRSEHYAGAGGPLTDLEVMGLANKYGAINSGLVSGELRELQMVGEGPVVKALHLQKPRDAIQSVSDYRENIARLATFRNGLKQGMSPPEAASFSLRHHIDYSNLSHAETSFWRYVVPFWTWWSRNVPLQVAGMAKNPGLYANVEKLRQQSLIAAGQDPNIADHMTGTDQENLPWGTPFHSGGHAVTAGPGLSYSDLSSIPTPRGSFDRTAKAVGQDVFGRSNPALQLGAVAAGIDPFTLSQHVQNNQGEYVPAPAFLPHDFPGVVNKFNKKSGQMERMVSWKELAALNAMPIATRLGKVTQSTTQPGKQTPGLAAASWLGGPTFKPADPHQLKLNDLYSQLDKINDWLDHHVADQPHKTGEPYKGQVGKAFKDRTKINTAIADVRKAMGFKNIKSPGRPKGSKKHKMFGGSGGGPGMFTGGG